MNWFDVLVLVAIGLSALNGLSKGIIRQGLALAGLIGGVILAGQRYQVLADRLPLITDSGMARVVSFVLIFLTAVVAATLLGQILRRAARLAMLGWADGLMGLVFGAVEAALFIQIILLLLLKFPLFGQLTFVHESSIGVVLLRYATLALGLLPAEFGDLAGLLPVA